MERNLLDCQRIAEENVVRVVIESPLFDTMRKKQRLAAYPAQEGLVKELVVRELLECLLDKGAIAGDILQVYRRLDHVLGSIGIRKSFVHQFEVFLLGAALLELTEPRGHADLSPASIEARKDLFTDWLYCSVFHDICKPREKLDKVVSELNLLITGSGGDGIEGIPEPKKPAVIDPEVLSILQDQLTDIAGARVLVREESHGALGAEWFFRMASRIGHDENRRNRIMAAIASHDWPVSELSGMKRSWQCAKNPLASLLLICDYLQDWGRSPHVGTDRFVEQYLHDFEVDESGRELHLKYVYRWGTARTKDDVIEDILKPKEEILSLISEQLGTTPLEITVSAFGVDDEELGTLKLKI